MAKSTNIWVQSDYVPMGVGTGDECDQSTMNGQRAREWCLPKKRQEPQSWRVGMRRVTYTIACKATDEWMKCAHSWVYCVSAQSPSVIYEHLGSIKKRADWTWIWWRWKSRFHEWTPGQGEALTKEEATAKVMEGWT